jgi:glycosyltransferase involved in cell wall biosynthesis
LRRLPITGLKIAIIIRRLNVRGGAQRQAIFLARTLGARGHEVTLYTFLPPGADAYADLLEGLRVVALGRYPASRTLLYDFFAEHRASRALARLIDRDTDLLNPHDQVSFQAAAHFKKRIRRVPSVWMMNDLPTRGFGAWRDRQTGAGRRTSFLKDLVARALDIYETATCIRAQDFIAVLDERDRGWVREFFRRDAEVVRSGIDAGRFPYREPQGIAAGRAIRILAVGILFPHRRFEDLIEAVSLARDRGLRIACVIVGGYGPGDPYYKKLLDLRRRARLDDAVRFAGRVSEDELHRLYRDSDIFVFPSHLQSWGLAVFEAMASGLPVIVSQSAGAAEVLTDGVNALIVPPRSPRAIADAIGRIAADGGLYGRLGRDGRRFVEENISWERYTDAMEMIFRKTSV